MSELRSFIWIPILLVTFIFCFSGNVFSSWPEFWLSSDCLSGGAQGTQTTSSIAFDGTNFLVVWEDERINIQRNIFATRVSLQGEILDPIGIPICTTQNLQSYANVAWGGQNYLVVWGDQRSGISAIYGARVGPDGDVLDPDGFLIAGGTDWALYPAVASDGTNFLVAWADAKSGYSFDIYVTRISPNGEVLDPHGISICPTYQDEFSPSIAYNGSTYLVAWELDPG